MVTEPGTANSDDDESEEDRDESGDFIYPSSISHNNRKRKSTCTHSQLFKKGARYSPKEITLQVKWRGREVGKNDYS
jgi:hypothetical protein